MEFVLVQLLLKKTTKKTDYDSDILCQSGAGTLTPAPEPVQVYRPPPHPHPPTVAGTGSSITVIPKGRWWIMNMWEK